MINNLLEAKAEKLLHDANCFYIPIDVNCCARHLNLVIQEIDLETEVSGFLAMNSESTVIGVNKSHGENRKRFTMAHELSHFILHAKKEQPLFIDKEQNPIQRIMFRDTSSSTGEYIKEREANAFAAALLMPKKLVEQEIQSITFDDLDGTISQLANKFQVSLQAMSIRLTNLDIIDYNAG